MNMECKRWYFKGYITYSKCRSSGINRHNNRGHVLTCSRVYSQPLDLPQAPDRPSSPRHQPEELSPHPTLKSLKSWQPRRDQSVIMGICYQINLPSPSKELEWRGWKRSLLSLDQQLSNQCRQGQAQPTSQQRQVCHLNKPKLISRFLILLQPVYL